jgi:hypothetical protein
VRLIAFGCSNTYGVGLEDCWDSKKETSKGYPPSKLAWPEHLSKLLGAECVNASRGGSSNRELWWRIINYEFQPDDIAVVLWTYPNRDCVIFDNNQLPEQLTDWHRNKTIQRFVVETYNEHDKRIESHTYIHHANLITQKYVPLYNFSAMEAQLCPYPKWQQFPILYDLEKIYSVSDRALDDEHPGPECHRLLSQEMYVKIDLIRRNQLPNFYPAGINKVTIN